MQQKAADELIGIERHAPGPLRILGRVILVVEGHPVLADAAEPLIGDGHAMGIAAQTLEHLLGTAERRLGVYHPLPLVESV